MPKFANSVPFRLTLLLFIVSCAGCANRATNESVSDKQNANSTTAADSDDHHYFHKSESEHAAQWSYEGENGPSHWGCLSPEYILANTGKQQSPIDLVGATADSLPAIEFGYVPTKINLVYNGHTIQETEDVGSIITVGKRKFELKQFHFHAPSEHTVDGKHFAMEMHLVHKDSDGKVGVVGVLIREGEHNKAFDPVWEYLPHEANKKLTYEAMINPIDFLPASKSYFHYMGSFTTPPCTESVDWFVLTEPIDMSKSQIERFTAIISGNNRPVQPLNGRDISRSRK